MPADELLLDITELVGNPLRTGIQRVERQIIRHWPGPARLVPCRFDASRQRFVSMSESIFDILVSDVARTVEAEHDLLRPRLEPVTTLSSTELAAGLFNPEVFFEKGRAAAYREVCRERDPRVSWLLYDFLPYLRPQDYPSGTARSCMHYVRALRDIPRVSSISELTQREYTERIMRDPGRTGPHFPLGGDGLQIERQQFAADKTSFAYFGTIEPRKNVAVILEAFEELWRDGTDVELVLVGRIDGRSTREIPMLERLKSEKRLKYLGHADDQALRDVLRNVRATIFISAIEGFGIPPYESLAAGIPTIVSSCLPSTALLPPGGRIVLPDITPQCLASAVKELLVDDRAAALWGEASQLVIPTWKEFAANVAGWVQGG